jgi:hypothetical protein
MALAAGTYMPAANAVAVALVPPERRARAIALVTGGMTVSLILGVPLGTAAAAIARLALRLSCSSRSSARSPLLGLACSSSRRACRAAPTRSPSGSQVARRGDVLLALGDHRCCGPPAPSRSTPTSRPSSRQPCRHHRRLGSARPWSSDRHRLGRSATSSAAIASDRYGPVPHADGRARPCSRPRSPPHSLDRADARRRPSRSIVAAGRSMLVWSARRLGRAPLADVAARRHGAG